MLENYKERRKKEKNEQKTNNAKNFNFFCNNNRFFIFATKGNSLITLQIGTPTMSVQTTDSSANNIVTLDTAPYIDGDYTLVPVRAVAEALSAQVDWSDETQTVSITTK